MGIQQPRKMSQICAGIYGLATKKQKWVFEHLNLKEEGQPFIHAVLSGHAVAVSDGSLKGGQGTAVWMMYDMQDLMATSGQGTLNTPDATQAQGSYRSEYQEYTEL